MAVSTRLCAAALVTALSIGPALAQTTTGPTTTTAPSSVRVDDRDGDFDWGLLGLLGLAGLAPLFMRKDRHGNVHADTRR